MVDSSFSRRNKVCNAGWKRASWGFEEGHATLKRGMQLIRQCAEPQSAHSVFILLGCAGEFCEIIDDVKRYSQMINKSIARIVKFDTTQNPNKPAKEELIKELQSKVELDCKMLQDALTSANEQQNNALIDSHSRNNRPWGSSKKGSRKGFVDMLEKGSIADSDLSITTCLGTGSFGVVNKAFWGGVAVAVKEFFYEDSFEEEYKVVTQLMPTNSSHIVQIFGHSTLTNTGRKALVMELMDMDLKKLLEVSKKSNPNAPLSLHESTDIMLQIAKGTLSLHRADVIHRDLKPSNILVKRREDESWVVKLADFGASKANFQTLDNNHTKTGTTMYMAPEMVADGGKYTRKVDVYSFGIVCTEIITGRPPDLIILENLRKGQMPSFPRAMIPWMIISRCLQLEEHKRPSFEEICDNLWHLKERIFRMVMLSLVPQARRAQMQIDHTGKFNYAVTGYTSTGKSSLINTLCRLCSTSQGAAPIGSEGKLKQDITPYQLLDQLVVWDMPGAGTIHYPAESYYEKMGLWAFDAILVLLCDRSRKINIEIAIEIAKQAKEDMKPVIFVLSKADILIKDLALKNRITMDKAAVTFLDTVKRGYRQELEQAGLGDVYIFAVSAKKSSYTLCTGGGLDTSLGTMEEMPLLHFLLETAKSRFPNLAL